MSSVQINKPYTIVQHKLNQYEKHYGIPSLICLVVPTKVFEDEVVCDVRWENKEGELQLKQGLFFKADNLRPLDQMNNYKLQEVWAHYYPQTPAENSANELDVKNN